MNIVYINHYAGSPALGMEYRPFYLSREWVRAGHKVQMLAASFSHLRSTQAAVGDTQMDGIDYRFYDTPPYRGNTLPRARNVWAFLRAVWRDAPRLARDFRPDVVIASSTYPLDIWVAKRLARLARAKLVFEVHDLWPLSPIEIHGLSPWNPFMLLCQTAEDTAYRHADVVVSMLPKVHEHMASRGLDLAKLHLVPNGITLDEWSGTAPPLRDDVGLALRSAHAAGRTVVGYAGSMGQPNALDNLLDAARILQDKPLHFVLVGDGHERERLVQRATDEGLANVSFLPPIPKAQIPSFLGGIDIAYIGWQRVPIYRFGIAPNKLMDYMMARCAVLHAVQAGNDPVGESGCGLTVLPDDPQAVAQGLLHLAARSPDERRSMGERGRAFVLAHHTYPVLARRFLDALR